ncbi:MAG: YgiQ family radical SAM protein, partial [Polyangia bacterium]|nr:YgiQ family radical SAM protein [Polyangia bacterium]
FGAAVVGRVLESFGLVVGIQAQPDWRDPESLRAWGPPRLFVGVTAGNMDSMVNHQTALGKRRHDDAYSPNGRHGLRPNRATVVYGQLARRVFPDRLLLLGGVEASLRRFAHYDCWEGSLRRSVLLDSRADLLVFGMAERPLRAIVDRLAHLEEADRGALELLVGIRGTALALTPRTLRDRGLSLEDRSTLTLGTLGFASGAGQDGAASDLPRSGLFREPPRPHSFTLRRLPSLEAIRADPRLLVEATRLVERTVNPGLGEALAQASGDAVVLAMPPAWPLTTPELDFVHELPYSRAPHPSSGGPVPAFDMIANSIQITRGCFGGCSFCAIALHEGRDEQSRSPESVMREIAALRGTEAFRGTISDLGGPTANTYRLGCTDPRRQARCRRPSCLHPRICPFLGTDLGPLRRLMALVRSAPGVRHVLVASGVRHDLALLDPSYLEDLVRHHVGGHLHVAPEHDDPLVLGLARKPPYALFEAFRGRFEALCASLGKERYLNPYFVSGLPGSTDERMASLVARLRAGGWRPRQVQAFVPTPGTAATAMFFGGESLDQPGVPVAMPRSLAERQRQHRLLVADLPGEGRGRPPRAPRSRAHPGSRRPRGGARRR